MTLHRALLVAPLLVACVDKSDDSATDTNAETGQPLATPTAVIATVDTTYSVGALATVTVEGWEIADSLATVSADPKVVTAGEHIVQLNRGTDNNVRVYEAGSFSEPLVEFSTGDGSNPHDAALCGTVLFVSMYGGTTLGVYDPLAGIQLETVDLSPYDDGDGYPEASDLVTIGNKLYVALQQLDQNNGWVANGGMVAEVDCTSRAVTNAWEVGASPDLFNNPVDPSTLIVRTGTYFDETGAFDFTGGLATFDPATGTSTSFLAEADLSANITGFAANAAGKGIVLTTDETWAYQVQCLDMTTGTLTLAESVPQYLSGVVANERGEAWISARTSWASPDPGGVLVYDMNACTSVTHDDWITLTLEPYSIAFY